MSASLPVPPDADHRAPADPVLTLTGERTIPDLDIENYWFRRHEVVYQRLAPRCADATCSRPDVAKVTAPI